MGICVGGLLLLRVTGGVDALTRDAGHEKCAGESGRSGTLFAAEGAAFLLARSSRRAKEGTPGPEAWRTENCSSTPDPFGELYYRTA